MVRRSHVRNSIAVGMLAALVAPMLAACGAPADTGTTTGAATAAPSTGTEAATTAPSTGTDAPTAAPVEATAAPAEGGTDGVVTSDTQGKVLRIQHSGYPENLDPQKMSFLIEIAMAQLNYEGLTKLDSELKAAPAAAESWTFNEAGDEITFKLREGLKYSDGSPLTAQNFAYAIERTCDPNTAGEYQSILFEVVGCADYAATAVTDTAALETARTTLTTDGVQVPDDTTLVVKLTNPAPYWPYIAGLWVMYPVKEESAAKGDNWWSDPANHIGNGPFKVTQMAEGQLISYVANENYWEGRPKLDGIDLVFVDSAAVALEAYRAGQLDIVDLSSDSTQIPSIKADAELGKELVSYPGASTFGMGFNLTQEPFTDKKVREAFAYALDRQTYCEVIRSGDCIPAYSWIPAGVGGAIETTAYTFDPEAAKQALAESSYGGPQGLPELKMTYNSTDASNQARAEWIAGQLREVLGIEVQLDPVDSKTLSGLRKNVETFPTLCFFCTNWFQDYPDPQNWLSLYWRTEGLASRIGYSSEEVDTLTKQADAELDPAKREELYKQANQKLVDDLPTAFGYHLANNFLVKPYVSGYTPTSADGAYPGERGSLLTLDVTK